MATETLTLSWYSDDTAGASAYIEDGTIICDRVYNQKQSGRIGWQEALSGRRTLLGLPKRYHNWLLERLGADWTLREAVSKEFVSKAIVFIREFLKTYSQQLTGY